LSQSYLKEVKKRQGCGVKEGIKNKAGIREDFNEDIYKTVMGTIPRSSSHSPFATEAACGVRLLLF
jgi:hypothetical protein